jgi:hypothetical protein
MNAMERNTIYTIENLQDLRIAIYQHRDAAFEAWQAAKERNGSSEEVVSCAVAFAHVYERCVWVDRRIEAALNA